MQILKLLGLLFTLSIVFIKPLQAKSYDNAQQILEKMSKAMRALNYRGTLALFRHGQLNTLQFYHAAEKGQEQERLLSLNSPLIEAVRTPTLVKCYYLDSKKIVIDHRPSRRSFLMDLPENFTDSSRAYDFVLGNQETVARMPAWVVYLKPKDAFRYERKIWVSKDNYLPLRFELLDDRHIVLEQMIFTELQVVNALPLVHIPIDKNDVKHIHRLDLLDFDNAAFKINNIPSGFKKVSFTKLHLHSRDRLVDHLLLSDGFSSVSIYLEENGTEPALESSSGYQAIGSVNFFTNRLKNYQLTVMGEVPVNTLEHIADNISLRRLPKGLSDSHFNHP